MKLSTTLFFATAALATASELDNLGPEWEPVDIADGTEVANAHRALVGEYKLLSCRKKCDGSNKGREIKICEYLVDGKYEVKKWEYWSKRSVCWGGTDRDPWSSSSSSSDSCRKEKKECKRKCDRRLLEEGIAEERALGSKSSKSSKNKGSHKLAAKSSKSSKSDTKKSDKGGKERRVDRGDTGDDNGTGPDWRRELGSKASKSSSSGKDKGGHKMSAKSSKSETKKSDKGGKEKRGDHGGDTGNDKGTGPDWRRELRTETSQTSKSSKSKSAKSSKSDKSSSSKSSKSSSKSSKSSKSSRTRSAKHGGDTGNDKGGGNTGPDNWRQRDLGSSKCKKQCKQEFRSCKRGN